MIIKSSRILSHHGKAIGDYFDAQGENDSVAWLLGEAVDLEFMGLTARLCGKLFCVRHFVIAPEQHLSQTDLRRVLSEISKEYGVSNPSGHQACLVQHQKPRSGAGEGDTHFHLALPEWDQKAGRMMPSSYTKMRDEKLARILELKFKHHPVVGRFNAAVYDAIAVEQPDLNLSPFEEALRKVALTQGRPAEDWKAVKAFAPKTAPHWKNKDGSELDVTTPLSC